MNVFIVSDPSIIACKYGIVYTIPKDIEDLAFHATLIELFVRMRTGETISVDEVAAQYECDVAEVEAAAKDAKVQGHITIEGGVIRRR